MTLAAKLWIQVGGDTSEADSKLAALSKRIQSHGEKLAHAGTMMTAAITLPLAALGAKAIKLAVDYSQAMNILQATSKASGAEMAKLDDLAQELGADLSLPATSASDAAEAMVELAKSGLSVTNVMKAARGVLQLSAAGNLSNARAAEIASNALNMFKLEGSQAVRVADMLAAGANRSSAEVTDMADALQMSGSVFASANIPLEDLVASIAEMANAGIKGSDAGTSLKQMLLSLQAPTAKAEGLMDDLGISIYNADGTMRPFDQIIGQFTGKLGNLTQEQRNATLATIFGSDAVRAANVVMMGGVGAFTQMKEAVSEEGAAAKLAAARMEGLAGSIQAMQSALETAGLALGQAASGPVAELAGKVTEAANAFSKLGPKAQEAWMKVALGAALLGPSLVVLGKLTTLFAGLPAVIGAATTALAAWRAGLTLTTALGAAGLSPLVLTLGAVALAAAAVVGVWAQWNDKIEKTNKEGKAAVESAWQDFFDRQVKSGKSATQVLEEYRKKQEGVQKTLEEAGVIRIFIKDQAALMGNTNMLNEALARTSSSYQEYLDTMEAGSGTTLAYTMLEWSRINATRVGTEAWNASKIAAEQMSQSLGLVAMDEQALAQAALDMEQAQKAMYDEMARGAQATQSGLGGMISQYDTLTGKMDAWLQNTAGQVVTMLGEKFTEASGKFKDALGILDEVMGTNYQKQDELKTATQNLVAEYAKTGDLDAFKTGLQKIKDEGLAGMKDELEKVTQKAQELYDKLLALPSEIKIRINFSTSEIPGWVGTKIYPKPDKEEEDYGRAAGGPVEKDRPYVVGERGPELFVPRTAGTIIPNQGLGNIEIGQIVLQSSATNADQLYREFVRRLEQEKRGRGNAGAVYAGR